MFAVGLWWLSWRRLIVHGRLVVVFVVDDGVRAAENEVTMFFTVTA